jgi:hypothetical protein
LFIDVDTPHGGHAFVEGIHGGESFGDSFFAPVKGLLLACLLVGELSGCVFVQHWGQGRLPVLFDP